MASRERLEAAIAAASEWLAERYDIAEFKARDRREPGRREKMRAERALMRDVARLFRRMAAAIRQRLEAYPRPAAKAETPDPMGDEWWDEQEAALRAILLRHMGRGASGGGRIFQAAVGVSIDPAAFNKQASKWVQSEYTKLSKTISDGVSDELRKQLQEFITTPGTTVGDVMERLGLETSHAEMIAITEITRAYAEGQRIAGEELQKDYPDLTVREYWFTNNDEIVCEICRPLNGTSVLLQENFTVQDKDGNTIAEIPRPPAHPRCRCWSQTELDV